MLQRADLNSSTKAVAAALSVQFANHETGQLNPSLKTLDEFLAGMSLATIKRCLRQLVELGWLFRTEGRGAGNCTEYDLRAPCKIIPFRQKKKGASVSFSNGEKGSSATEKRLTGELSHIKDKQSKEQNPSLEPNLPDGRLSGSALGLVPQAVFVSRLTYGCRIWETFSEEILGSRIERLFPLVHENGQPGFWLPGRFPPTDTARWREFRDEMVSDGWLISEYSERGYRCAV
ncbi:helix-turn-helix domain-containing protein [Thalassobius sp. Cn5-15]|uniref:helix-turn-helix domain-containing protein n=1 Tax=Thalassobius sp. Cn5-15 TaxID=2917763 RepID=UPI001EF18EB0|nr:helix-turn-helix domain-containing protein [Thalassobius sp. Cn5-15]MCG7493059.1 helix-turn-helix domain-containing protein [Thalassobius sp. Cn5-15]